MYNLRQMASEKLPNIGAAIAVRHKPTLDELILCAKQIGDESFGEAAATDSTEKFPVETLRKIAENYLLSAPLPEDFGGKNLGLESGTNHALLQILKHFGRGNLVVGRVYEGHFNALLLINLFGTNEQIERFAAHAKTADCSEFGIRKPATA